MGDGERGEHAWFWPVLLRVPWEKCKYLKKKLVKRKKCRIFAGSKGKLYS